MENLPMIIGNLKDDNLVQKSIPFLFMNKNPYSLGEMKVLDTYLSRINSHEPDSRKVTFTKKEYEKLMGISEIRIEQLEKYTASMMSKIARIKISETEFTQINIFCESRFKKDEFGEWTITLECSEKAKKYIFDIEKIRYIKYLLKYTIGFKSKYSMFLYGYLLYNRYRISWSESLTNLRKSLQCDSDYYKDFRQFRTKILDKALEEVNEITDVEFTYRTEKKGRTVVSIRFDYIKQQKELPEPQEPDNGLKIYGYEEGESPHQYNSKNMEFLASACNDEFSQLEMSILFNMLARMDLYEYDKDVWRARYRFLSGKYNAMNYYESREPIRHRFAYLRAIVEADLEKHAIVCS